jgi:hypothetical protein
MTGLRAGRPSGRSSSPGRVKNVHFFKASIPALGTTQPRSYPVGTGALSTEVKRQEREADRSPPTSAEVTKTWVCTSSPPYVFMAY